MFAILILLLIAMWLFCGVLALGVARLVGYRGKLNSWTAVGIYSIAPFVMVAILTGLGWVDEKVQPSRNEILGKYRIDRNFYPGPQADWQHETYRMTITDNWVEIRDTRTKQVWAQEIKWMHWPKYRWRFEEAPAHHMLRGGPAIIRERFGFYYVFESPLYGTVVFRKEGATTKKKVLFGLGLTTILIASWWTVRRLNQS